MNESMNESMNEQTNIRGGTLGVDGWMDGWIKQIEISPQKLWRNQRANVQTSFALQLLIQKNLNGQKENYVISG